LSIEINPNFVIEIEGSEERNCEEIVGREFVDFWCGFVFDIGRL